MTLQTVGNLKDSVAGILQGTNLNNVTNLKGAIERSARILAQQADVPEASGRQDVTLYDGVYDYPAPETIFGGALVDIRPQGVTRSPWDVVIKRPVEMFDRNKTYVVNGYEVTFEWDAGVGIMRVAQRTAKGKVLLDRMDDTDGWTVGGSLTNLAVDSTVFYESPSSLRFLLSGSSTGTLTKTLDNSIDMEEYENVGVAFLAIRIPDGATATDLASISLKLGSSASAYDEVTATEAFLGAWTAGNWLLAALDFSTATSTGTPDWTAIDYVQVGIAHTGTLTNFRLGGLFMSLPSPHEVLYQSAAIFSVNGTLSNTITDDDDDIILNNASYTILEYVTAEEIALQSGGMVSEIVIKRIQDKLHNKETGLLPKYRSDNPSEELRQIGSYYDCSY